MDGIETPGGRLSLRARGPVLRVRCSPSRAPIHRRKPQARSKSYGVALGSRVTLEASGAGHLHLEVDSEEIIPPGAFSLVHRFELIADYCAIRGLPASLQVGDSVTLRGSLPELESTVEFVAQSGSLGLSVSLPPQHSRNVFPEGGIPIATVALVRQTETGDPLSSLTGRGTISYVDYPEMKSVPLERTDYLELDGLERFRIAQSEPTQDDLGIHLQLQGVAGGIRSGPREFLSQSDRRLTAFDELWQSRALAAFFTILLWVVPTTVGAIRWYKELPR